MPGPAFADARCPGQSGWLAGGRLASCSPVTRGGQPLALRFGEGPVTGRARIAPQGQYLLSSSVQNDPP